MMAHSINPRTQEVRREDWYKFEMSLEYLVIPS